MKYNFLKAIFGGKTTEATETTTVTANVASINTTTATLEAHRNEGEEVHHTEAEIKAMSVEKALETLRNQYTEKKATILEKATTVKKLEKALEKAHTEAMKAEAVALEAEALETATEKEKKCKRYVATWWHTMTETLEEAHTEAMKAEAEKKAHMEAVKAEAVKALEAVATSSEVWENVTTEVLEAMKAVATEKAEEKKEKALEATNEATEAKNMKKATTVAVAQRHIEEGRGTEKEMETFALYEVEAEKSSIYTEAMKKVKETMKAVAEKVKAEISKEYTVSKAINKMKEEAEEWQNIYNTANVAINVATMTPATIFSSAHVFLLVPSCKGLKIGTGRGVKAVEKWTLETLHQYIIINDTLNKMNIDTATVEKHRHTLEKAVEAMKAVAEAEALKKAMKAEKEAKKAEKAEAEKATSTATVAEIEKATEAVETATVNEKAVAEVLAEVKAEATEALAEVKAEKVETMETVKEAKKASSRRKKATEAKKAVKKATEALAEVKAEKVA